MCSDGRLSGRSICTAVTAGRIYPELPFHEQGNRSSSGLGIMQKLDAQHSGEIPEFLSNNVWQMQKQFCKS
jgi:hypothetical protein